MKDLGLWSVHEQGGRIYFMYRTHTIGSFSGSIENARYMVACINAALGCWSAIDDEIQAEAEAPVAS